MSGRSWLWALILASLLLATIALVRWWTLVPDPDVPYRTNGPVRWIWLAAALLGLAAWLAAEWLGLLR